MDQTIVGTALPKIVAQLRGYDIYAWVFAAYYLGATATATVVGRLSDLFGRKRLILLSVTVTASAIKCFRISSSWMNTAMPRWTTSKTSRLSLKPRCARRPALARPRP